MTRINIEIPQDKHRSYKTFAAAHDLSLKDLLLSAVDEKITRELTKIPNEETIQAFKDSDNNKNLTAHKSVETLLNDLEL